MLPLPIEATNVPLPASPPPEGSMEVDDGTTAKRSNGIQLLLLLALNVIKLFLLLLQIHRNSQPSGLGGRM
jgi:hypothetical protein